jgi:asparagine synthase (glutamine-hydrolysing)
MCGICGFQARHIDPVVLRRMNARLTPRGPDAEGYHCADGVGLAMRRLSVIDPAGGDQPITNEDGTLYLVFNGEIYNFRELRDELLADGHRFATASDTEVIVHGYEQWGAAVIERLSGMFAFALWDASSRSWFLARDRMGEKPLYYYHGPGLFAFASEPKSLLEHPGVARTLDPVGLAAYLTFEYVPSPDSIYEGVRKLPPAHRMLVRGADVCIQPYWSLPARAAAEAAEARLDDSAWPAALRARLGAAVERQLVSDVPLGCFLSGGLDSSAIAVLMAERLGAENLKTFSIGFTEKSFDESDHARVVARHLGTDHHVEILAAAQLFDLLPSAVDLMDEPLGDGSVLPTLALASFARSHVTVALSGDGGDELLGGYPTLFADRWAETYRRFVPAWAHPAITGMVRRIPASPVDMSWDFKAKRFLHAARLPSDHRHFGWVGSFLPSQLPHLLHRDVRAAALARSPYDRVDDALATGALREGLDRLLFLYARFYLAEDVLVKVDRCTMAAGLETRAPFLDPDFVRFAAALPTGWKVRGTRTKIALRQAFRDSLPGSIVRRPKKGFGMPVAKWMRGSLRSTVLELLGPERLQRQKLFDVAQVQRLCREHMDGVADHRKPLWTLLAFQLWHARHMERA